MAGKLGALLFGGIFAAFGIGFFILMVWPALSLAIKTQGWQPTPATLQSLNLETHRGDDGTTYKVSGGYRYSWNGTKYSGNRLFLMDMSDNIGGFHQDLYRELNRARNNNQPVTVWVDPSNPSESILNRDLRWGLLALTILFSAVFSVVGIAIMFFAFKRKTPSTLATGDLTGSQHEPWLENRKWQTNIIFSNVKARVFVLWFFAAICDAVSIQILAILPSELDKGNHMVLIALLFPLVGILLTWQAIVATLRWRRFGGTPLIMDPFPGSIGGDIGGHIDINLPYDPNIACQITVNCIFSYISGSGKNRSRRENVIWQDDGIGETQRFNGKTQVRFRFEVPEGLPQSDINQGERYHLWRIHAHCDLPGADFDHTFEIPVFPTAEKSSLQSAPSREHASLKDAAQTAIETFLQITHNHDGMELFMPMGRRIGGSFSTVLIGLIFLAAGIGIFHGGGPKFLSGIFSLIGSLLVLGGIVSLGTGLRTQFKSDGIYIVKYLYGVIVSRKFISRESIQTLTARESMSSNNGGKKTSWYTIQAVTRDKKKIPVALRMKGQREAEVLLESIRLLSGYA